MGSTQKLLLVTIFINLVVIVSLGAYQSAHYGTVVNQYVGYLDEQYDAMQVAGEDADSSLIREGTATVIDNNIVDPIKTGWGVLTILFRGMVGTGLDADLAQSNGEQLLIYAIKLFRWTLWGLLALELIMLWRNKKTS